MEEVWETPYANAILKIERADKHIADFGERIFASSDRYGPSLHMNGDTGEKFLYYGLGDRFLRSDLALIAGDAIHNLRCALDIAWGEIVGNSGTTFTKFPIDSNQSRQWLEGVVTKNAGINRGSSIFDFVVNQVKPYKGGDSDILALNTLDINDKHLLLIPTIAVTGISGVELEDEDGTVDRFDITLTRPAPYRKVVGMETKLKNHGEVRFKITFGKGTPTENLEVIPTLERFSGKVGEIVRKMKRMK